METKLYKIPGYTRESENVKAFKKELTSFILYNAFYSVDEFVSL